MRKWIPSLLVIVAVLATLAVYSRLPEQVPTHWNMSGEVDDWSSRLWGAWTIPLVMAAMLLVFRAFPLIDPRRENYPKFAGAYEGILIIVLLFMLALHVSLLATMLGRPIAVMRLLPVGIGLLLVGIGALLPKAHANWFIGIRTPWTLSNDRVWERTHRFGGVVMIGTGLLIGASAMLVPLWTHRVMAGAIAAMAIIVIGYSYFAWRQEVNG
ncbi:MAG TPA: DUF1648 domain-containing protein [Gemmatimonadaceae bacterium]|nr:DUF1648 domain-containing protein [Gemmatimonadaceae bacterium]